MQNHELIEEIKTQVMPWKSRTENYLMLTTKGYKYDDVEKAMESFQIVEDETKIDSDQQDGDLSIWKVLIILFCIIAIFGKLYRFSGSGNFLFLFGIITAVWVIIRIFSGDKKDGNGGLY